MDGRPPPSRPPPAKPSLRDRRLRRAAKRTVESRTNPDLSAVGEFFAFLGIAFGFLLLLTIPGWYGVRAWRRYGRGEPSSIRVYEYLGIAAVVGLIIGMVGIAITKP